MRRFIKFFVVAVMLTRSLTVGDAMARPNDDISMLLNRAGGVQLATRSVALTLAEMLIKNIYGEENFKTQLPLRLTDGGDRWIIEGSRQPDAYPVSPGELARGKIEIIILKDNCQVVRFIQKAYVP